MGGNVKQLDGYNPRAHNFTSEQFTGGVCL